MLFHQRIAVDHSAVAVADQLGHQVGQEGLALVLRPLDQQGVFQLLLGEPDAVDQEVHDHEAVGLLREQVLQQPIQQLHALAALVATGLDVRTAIGVGVEGAFLFEQSLAPRQVARHVGLRHVEHRPGQVRCSQLGHAHVGAARVVGRLFGEPRVEAFLGHQLFGVEVEEFVVLGQVDPRLQPLRQLLALGLFAQVFYCGSEHFPGDGLGDFLTSDLQELLLHVRGDQVAVQVPERLRRQRADLLQAAFQVGQAVSFADALFDLGQHLFSGWGLFLNRRAADQVLLIIVDRGLIVVVIVKLAQQVHDLLVALALDLVLDVGQVGADLVTLQHEFDHGLVGRPFARGHAVGFEVLVQVTKQVDPAQVEGVVLTHGLVRTVVRLDVGAVVDADAGGAGSAVWGIAVAAGEVDVCQELLNELVRAERAVHGGDDRGLGTLVLRVGHPATGVVLGDVLLRFLRPLGGVVGRVLLQGRPGVERIPIDLGEKVVLIVADRRKVHALGGRKTLAGAGLHRRIQHLSQGASDRLVFSRRDRLLQRDQDAEFWLLRRAGAGGVDQVGHAFKGGQLTVQLELIPDVGAVVVEVQIDDGSRDQVVGSPVQNTLVIDAAVTTEEQPGVLAGGAILGGHGCIGSGGDFAAGWRAEQVYDLRPGALKGLDRSSVGRRGHAIDERLVSHTRASARDSFISSSSRLLSLMLFLLAQHHSRTVCAERPSSLATSSDRRSCCFISSFRRWVLAGEDMVGTKYLSIQTRGYAGGAGDTTTVGGILHQRLNQMTKTINSSWVTRPSAISSRGFTNFGGIRFISIQR